MEIQADAAAPNDLLHSDSEADGQNDEMVSNHHLIRLVASFDTNHSTQVSDAVR